MKNIFPWIVFLSVHILFVSCSTDSGKQNLKSGKLTIVYSGNIGGLTNPCGCRIPMGGLAKRATIINEIRKETQNIVIFDSGALLYQNNHLYPPYDYFLRIIANLVTDVMTETGLDALNVTSRDLANSPDSLLALNKAVPLLSANIVWKDSGELLFKPDKVCTVGDIRVGVFGFMAQQSLGADIFKKDAPVRVLDPLETARKEVLKLKKEGDLVVALTYMDLEKVKELVEKVPGIHVVIASHTRTHKPCSDHDLFQSVRVDNTIIVRCPDGGRVLGRLDLEIVNGSTEFVDRALNIDLRPAAIREKEKSSGTSNYRNLFIDLDYDVKSDTAIQEKINIVEGYVQAYKDSLGLK